MKLPFVSRKKYENAINNYKTIEEAREQLNKTLMKCTKENTTLYKMIDEHAKTIEELKKDNRILKATLTRHGVNYRKNDKNDK